MQNTTVHEPFLSQKTLPLQLASLISMPSTPWPLISTLIMAFLALLPPYLLLCSTLRFQRIKSILKQYPYGNGPHQKPFSAMSVTEARDIIHLLISYEFPALYGRSLQFSLFRTYGIPTISSLLLATQQLSTTKWAGKRYADTAVLISEIYGNDPGSDRALTAFSRLNYLHGHYIKAAKISNDDMLYTLALFMNQPVQWINRYEWRQLTRVEVCALGVFHLYMGRCMEIDLSVLPSGSESGDGDRWRDGLHFYEELDEWAERYEKRWMVPAKCNRETAVHTRAILLVVLPKWARGVGEKVVTAVCDERLRKAMMFEEVGWGYHWVVEGVLRVRRWWLRWACLPRWTEVGGQPYVSREVGEGGSRWFTRYEGLPHYVKPTVWNRWGPSAWMSRMIGVPLPGDDGMYPDGFVVSNTGPKAFDGKGMAEAEKTTEKLRPLGNGGCPFMTIR